MNCALPPPTLVLGRAPARVTVQCPRMHVLDHHTLDAVGIYQLTGLATCVTCHEPARSMLLVWEDGSFQHLARIGSGWVPCT